MKKIMLTVSYECNSRDKNGRARYWADSYLKNKIVCMEEKESVHDVVKRVLQDEDFVKCAKKFRPETEIFVDTKDGQAKQVGWIYKVKQSIQKENYSDWVEVPFSAWVEIKAVDDFQF